MKKSLLAVLMAVALSTSALAVDVGTYGGRMSGGGGNNIVGVSLGESVGKLTDKVSDKFAMQGTYDRSTTQKVNLNRYTVSGSYNVYEIEGATINVRAGLAYLQPQTKNNANGGAAFLGAGISYPVYKDIALVADYAYQKGNNITKGYNGNVITAGAKYSF